MTRNLRQRLQKLEAQAPRQPTEQDEQIAFHGFLRLAVAYYLGDPAPDGGPEEAPADAYARALGYPRSFEFRQACEANDADLSERVRLANSKLLEKFGVTWEHEGGAIVDACRRMEAGLSESYKQRLYGNLHETIRWDCLGSA
jgi:hypothetical protein